ncbi:flagellar basal body P-ring protein FlgI [Vibrio lentus]|nr:flagellar basal body P-ring protein FlgI [Vibrio lentus]
MRQLPYRSGTFNAMLQNFGIQLPPGTKPKTKRSGRWSLPLNFRHSLSKVRKLGCNSIFYHSAKSLRGGTLLLIFQKRLDGQGRTYAVAQGNLR